MRGSFHLVAILANAVIVYALAGWLIYKIAMFLLEGQA